MVALWLLSVAAAIEVATGLALMIFPQAVASLLLGADLTGAGISVGRIAGVALLSLGLVCWTSRQDANRTPAFTAMLTYNPLVAVYLMNLGFGSEHVGILLWPGIAVHAVLSLLFTYVYFNDHRNDASAR
jgi:hypothetical protein